MSTNREVSDAAVPGARSTDLERTVGVRPNARRELVEQSILDHAARLFAERGYAGTSLQDIADEVGLTRPALYHYVSSKDDLLAKLITETTEDAAAAFQSIADQADLEPAQKIHAIMSVGVRRQAERRERFKLLIRSEAELPPEVATQHDASRRQILRSLARVIDQGISTGAFRPQNSRIAALAILGINNWVAWWYHPEPKSDLDEICNQLADMAVASLESQEARASNVIGVRDVLALVRDDLDRLERLIDEGPT